MIIKLVSKSLRFQWAFGPVRAVALLSAAGADFQISFEYHPTPSCRQGTSPWQLAETRSWKSLATWIETLSQKLQSFPKQEIWRRSWAKKAQSLLDTWLDSLQIEGINTYRASSWANYSNLLECTIGCMKLCSNHSPKNAETVIQVNSLTVQDTTNFRAASFCNFFRYIIGFLDRPWSMDWWRQQPQQRRWQQDPGL